MNVHCQCFVQAQSEKLAIDRGHSLILLMCDLQGASDVGATVKAALEGSAGAVAQKASRGGGQAAQDRSIPTAVAAVMQAHMYSTRRGPAPPSGGRLAPPARVVSGDGCAEPRGAVHLLKDAGLLQLSPVGDPLHVLQHYCRSQQAQA